MGIQVGTVGLDGSFPLLVMLGDVGRDDDGDGHNKL